MFFIAKNVEELSISALEDTQSTFTHQSQASFLTSSQNDTPALYHRLLHRAEEAVSLIPASLAQRSPVRGTSSKLYQTHPHSGFPSTVLDKSSLPHKAGSSKEESVKTPKLEDEYQKVRVLTSGRRCAVSRPRTSVCSVLPADWMWPETGGRSSPLPSVVPVHLCV